MSLFGSMTTAIGGLTAQSRALGHISDNVANSQTLGFKRIDTSFVSYITSSSQRLHTPGSVVARPDFTHTVQGTIEQTENKTALAVAGQGFFSVAAPSGEVNGLPTFDPRQFYTRAGDFSLDRNGFLVNSAGYFLQGWRVDPNSRDVDRTAVQPIRVSQLVSNPVATSEVTLAANLPANPPEGRNNFASSVGIYDALGEQRTLQLQWTRAGSNNWRLDVVAPGSTLDPVGGGNAIPGFDDQAMSSFNVQTTIQPVQQQDDITVPAVVTNGQFFQVTINGIVISYTATATDTSTTVRNQLISRINTDAATLGVNATAQTGSTLRLNATSTGTPYTLVTSSNLTVTPIQANTAPQYQTDSFTFSGTVGEVGDEFTISLDGITGGFPSTKSWTYTTTGTEGSMNSVVNGLAALINADSDSPAVATVSGSILTLTAKRGVPIPSWNVAPAESEVTIGTVVVGAAYQVTLNGNLYSYIAQPGNTQTQIRNALINQINTGLNPNPASVVDADTLSVAAGAPNPNLAGQTNVTATLVGSNIQIDIGTAVPGNTYALLVNGVLYTYTALPGNTQSDIRDALITQFNTTPPGPARPTTNPAIFAIAPGTGNPLEVTVAGNLTEATGGTRTANGSIPPHIQVTFGAAGDPARAGTITSLSAANVAGGTATVPGNQLTGDRAFVDVVVNYGSGPQNVRLFLGSFGLADGVTQFAGADYAVRSLEQNGVPQGSFSSLAIRENGDVIINYDNGQSRVINRIPVVTFNEADKLERVDGQAFLRTTESGEARILDPSRDGAGKLVVGSVERSNVDMAAEFSKLIIAQRAYTANTRIVSASDEMLQDTLNMKR
jgi:flagellar hook protein FlgE